MVKKRPCCIPGCKDVTSIRHRFPKSQEDVYDVWVERINPKLRMFDKLKVYNKYYICHSHFHEECKNEGSKQLKIYSLPTLRLPGFLEPSSKENSFLYPNNVKAQILAQKEQKGLASVLDTNSNKCTTITSVSTPLQSAESYPSMDVTEEVFCNSVDAETPVRRAESKRCPRKQLLSHVSVTRAKHLTPKAHKFYKTALKLHRYNVLLGRKIKNYKTRVNLAERYSLSDKFENVVNKVNNVTYKFLLSQARNQHIKKHGWRFTLDDKIFALSLAKVSSKGYKLLEKYFALPSRRTLTKVLHTLKFEPGVNPHIFSHLKTVVAKLNAKDRYCCLLFDEMALCPGVFFNEHSGFIEGFEDLGDGQRKPCIAQHALVFMLRGVRRRWKQPVAYVFTEKCVKMIDLVRCIKTVISACQNSGLTIVATVCDQSAANQGAINYLLNETNTTCLRNDIENRFHGFVVNDLEIVPLFDPPHLLKGIRNNLLTKSVQFDCGKGTQVASWKDILDLFKIDSHHQQVELRACPKLTAEHVVPEKIKKMKVRNCSQVFSQRVSAIMRLLAQWGNKDGLQESAIDTADFLLFMDKLFDSVNGTAVRPVIGKPLLAAVTATSPHIQFWREALNVLSSFKFIDGKSCTVPPSVKNWVRTLKGLICICEKMQTHGFKFLAIRNFNQDPLENFFGSIRSHGVRNVNPTCVHFRTSFKSLLLNNLTSSHSVGSNCEEDDNVGVLDSLKEMLVAVVPHCQPSETPSFSHPPNNSVNVSSTKISEATKVYVSGSLARKVLQKTKGCIGCKTMLYSDTTIPNSEFIAARAYSVTSLCYPSTVFTSVCNSIASTISAEMSNICHVSNVAEIIAKKTIACTSMLNQCPNHNLGELVVRIVSKFFIHQWCNNINRILDGKLVPIKFDPVKKAAHNIFTKKHHKK